MTVRPARPESGLQKEGEAGATDVAESKGPPARGRPIGAPERAIFAANFRRAREEAGMTQREVSRLLKVRQPFISAVETAQTNISIDRMSELASFIGKPLHELLHPRSRKG